MIEFWILQLHQIGNSWQYDIKWHLDTNRDENPIGSEELKQSIVVVTSKPRQQSDRGLIQVDSWTSHDGMDASSNASTVAVNKPFAIYVKVQRDSSPVLGAKVTAQLEVLHINGSTLQFAPLELLDDGFAGKDVGPKIKIFFLNWNNKKTTAL